MTVKTSDILKDDGAIKKVVDEMERLEKAFDNIILKAKKLDGETSNLNASQSTQRDTIKKNADTAEQMAKEYDKLTKLYDNQAIQLAALKNAQTQLNKVNKLEATIQASKFTSLNNLNAQLKLAKERYEQMTDAEKESSTEGKKLESQLSRLTARITTMKKEQREAVKIKELEIKATKSQSGSYNQLSAQYSILKIKLNKMSLEQRNNTKAGKAMEMQAKEIYSEMKRLQEVTGKNTLNVGNYSDALSDLPGILGRVGQGVGNVRSQFTKLLRNPIVLALAAIVGTLSALFSSLKRSEEGQNALNRVMLIGKSIFDNVADIVTLTATAILNLGQGFDEVVAKIRGFRKEIEEDVKNAKNLADQQAAFNKLERDLLVENARLAKESAQARSEAEELKLNAAEEGVKKLEESFDLEEKILQNEITLARQRLSIRKQESDLAVDDIEAKRGIAQAEADIETAQSNSAAKKRERIRNLNAFELEANNQRLKIAKNQLAIDELNLQEEIRINEERLVSENLTLDKRLELIAANLEKTINFKQSAFDVENQLLQAQFDAQIISLEEYQTEKLLLETKGFIESEKLFNEFRARVGDERDQDFLQKELDSISSSIVEFQEEIADFSGEESIKEKKSIFDLLGISVSDEQLEGIKSAFDFAKNQLTEFASLRTELADQAVQDANNEISSLENQLQVEIESRNAGFANRVETVQQELDLQKEAQQQAIEERRKAQRAEQAIQTVEQATNLITASAKINAQVGFPASVPLIALMFGAFTAAKVKAFQLTKQEFSEGGLEILGGGTHASGRDTDLGFTTSDGKRAFGERDEAHMILKAKRTRQYKNILPSIWESLTNGTFEDKFMGSHMSDMQVFNLNSSADMSKTESELEAIKRQGERATYSGNVRTYKNLVQRVTR